MAECSKCGDEVRNKNTAGHYRDRCCGCLVAAAPQGDRPIPGCECEKCADARD